MAKTPHLYGNTGICRPLIINLGGELYCLTVVTQPTGGQDRQNSGSSCKNSCWRPQPPVLQPEDIRALILSPMAAPQPILLHCALGRFFPALLAVPRLAALNIHASLAVLSRRSLSTVPS